MTALRRLVLALCAVGAAGCVFPNLGMLDDDEFFAPPTLIATYTAGSATLAISRGGTQTVVTLDRVGAGSQLVSMPGAGVSWRNDEGWVLQLNTYSMDFGMPRASGTPEDRQSYSGDVTLQLIHDHEFWRADSYSPSGNRCIVDLAEVSATSISGTATCRGLRWTDGTAALGISESVYIAGEEAFDAEISFEARP